MSPLHTSYRPRTFDEFVGNDQTITALVSLLEKEDKPHSYLLSGPSGCGKTTIARLIADKLGCTPMEFIEMNTANTRGIDTIRRIIEGAAFYPLMGDIKVYLFDEVHQVTGAAAEAMLKFLEDTPSYVYIILSTTLPEKLSATMRGRCTPFTVNTLNTRDMTKLLKWVLASEQKEFNPKLVDRIISAAQGVPRKALVYLDQVIDLPLEEALAMVDKTATDEYGVIDLCRLLIQRSTNKWPQASTMLKAMEEDPEQIRRAILGYFSSALLKANGQEAQRIASILLCFEKNVFDSGKPGLVLQCFRACLDN